MNDQQLETAACAAHMANRAVCMAQGDLSQAVWAEAPDWQRSSAINGVRCALAGSTPEQLHESWSAEKVAAGWKWGPSKDVSKLEHPCLVPYADLPLSQRVKDQVFADTVRAVAATLEQV